MMIFNTIIVNFDDADEQARIEDAIQLPVWEHSIEDLWTEFDISDCSPDDLATYFNEVLEEEEDDE